MQRAAGMSERAVNPTLEKPLKSINALELALLALEVEPVFREMAREKQQGGQGGVLLLPNSTKANPVNTRKEIACA